MTSVELMRLAIAEARKCHGEDNNVRPKVGAVIALNGAVLATGYRNENNRGSHAEFIALEKAREKGLNIKGSTIYTTLEPCMVRKKGKTPCAQRLVDAEVAQVFYGMHDPHHTVQGNGLLLLRRHQIPIESFSSELSAELEDINSDFLAFCTRGAVTEEYVMNYAGRRLDELYRIVNRIYWQRNLTSSPSEITTHLVGVLGGIARQMRDGKQARGDNKMFFVKSLAWWLALCGRMGVRSVEQMLWAKFPGVCPYCSQCPHTADCSSNRPAVDWKRLETVGRGSQCPTCLSGWLAMFAEIYPETILEPLDSLGNRLFEEVGELADAVRTFDVAPGLFLDEAPDVFAWILQLFNAMFRSRDEQLSLDKEFCLSYPEICTSCRASSCICPSILPMTVGRLGGSYPPITSGHRSTFMPVDQIVDVFGQ